MTLLVEGDTAEGGGQVLRTSLALSALTGRPMEIVRIRRRRSPPGLKAQHLAAVRLAADLCGARVEGDRPGSEELLFVPGCLQAGSFRADIGTAGSLTLMLQAVLLPALFAPGPVRLHLRGGTDVRWSPPADYASSVVLPYFRFLGSVRETVGRRGYYPEGGGVLEVEIRGAPGAAPGGWPRPTGPALDLVEAGFPREIRGVSSASQHLRGRRVAERQAAAAREVLAGAGLDLPVSLVEEYCPSASPGSAVVLWVEGECGGHPWRLGADRLGARGLPAEEVGASAARLLVERLQRPEPVEEHLADHLVPLVALFGGHLRCQDVSGHVQANLYVAGLFSERDPVVAGNLVGFV